MDREAREEVIYRRESRVLREQEVSNLEQRNLCLGCKISSSSSAVITSTLEVCVVLWCVVLLLEVVRSVDLGGGVSVFY